jgi:hypothetical protein
VSYFIVGISGESIGPIAKGLGLLAALSKSKSFSIVLSVNISKVLFIAEGSIVPSYTAKLCASLEIMSSTFQSAISVSSAIMTSAAVSADLDESELDLRLYPVDDSEEESPYDPAGDAVEDADTECGSLVSSIELCSGIGLLWFAGFGEPKLARS